MLFWIGIIWLISFVFGLLFWAACVVGKRFDNAPPWTGNEDKPDATE